MEYGWPLTEFRTMENSKVMILKAVFAGSMIYVPQGVWNETE